jgi:hypothetical protein
MNVPQQKLTALKRPRLTFDQHQKIFAPGVYRLPLPRPLVLSADFSEQVGQPAFAVVRLADLMAHGIYTGRLNEPLQRFNRVENHGSIVAPLVLLLNL